MQKKPINPDKPVSQGKRGRTRQTLIDTAAALIREHGYAKVSMEQVAAKAGVSRGSIYGNFKDRNELILAVALSRMPRIMPTPMPGASLREQLRAMGKAVAQAARDNCDNTVHWMAYMLHTMSDPELKQRAAVQGQMLRKMIAQEWSKTLPVDALPMPIDTFVKVLTSLTSSMIIAHSMTPDDFDEAVIVSAFEGLAGPAAPSRPTRKR